MRPRSSFMPKLLARIVVLLLAPCLLADPALTAALPNTQMNPPLVPGTKVGLKAVIFSEQALAESSLLVHPSNSKLASNVNRQAEAEFATSGGPTSFFYRDSKSFGGA